MPEELPQRERCPNKGCSANLLPGEIEAHRSACLFAEYICTNEGCTEKLRVKDQKVHIKTCPYRKVPCRWVNEGCTFSALFKDARAHSSDCKYRPQPCCYQKYGCKVLLSSLSKGMHESVCPWKRIKCKFDGCNFIDIPSQVTEHEKDCQYIKTICVWEGCNLQFSELDADVHQALCPHRIQVCSFDGCNKRIKALHMAGHQRNCEWHPVQCSFFMDGCTKIIPICQHDSHIQDCEYRKVKCTNVGCHFTTCALYMDNHSKFCPHSICDCPYKGCGLKLQRLEARKHAENCPHRPAKCPNHERGCTVTIKAGEIHNHIKNDCNYRLVHCNFVGCKAKLPVVHIELHQAECPHRQIPCNNDGCTALVKASMLAAHVSTCPHRIVPCPNFRRGCAKRLQSLAMSRHSENCDYRLVLCNNSGCEQSMLVVDSKKHAAKCPYRLVPCPTGYCNERIRASDCHSHMATCLPKCTSGVHNFPVCDFRCLRKCYKTQSVHIFNSGQSEIHIQRGERFDSIAKVYGELQFGEEDRVTRLSRNGYVVADDAMIRARSAVDIHLKVQERPGAMSKMMASPVRVHWTHMSQNRRGQNVGDCSCQKHQPSNHGTSLGPKDKEAATTFEETSAQIKLKWFPCGCGDPREVPKAAVQKRCKSPNVSQEYDSPSERHVKSSLPPRPHSSQGLSRRDFNSLAWAQGSPRLQTTTPSSGATVFVPQPRRPKSAHGPRRSSSTGVAESSPHQNYERASGAWEPRELISGDSEDQTHKTPGKTYRERASRARPAGYHQLSENISDYSGSSSGREDCHYGSDPVRLRDVNHGSSNNTGMDPKAPNRAATRSLPRKQPKKQQGSGLSSVRRYSTGPQSHRRLKSNKNVDVPRYMIPRPRDQYERELLRKEADQRRERTHSVGLNF